MASKDRILRLKEETRINILDASLQIVKEDGWQALSMRKIADVIEYTAPIIYEYFSNKEAILRELTRKGFLILGRDMKAAKEKNTGCRPNNWKRVAGLLAFRFRRKGIIPGNVWRGYVNCCELARDHCPKAKVPQHWLARVIERT